MVIGVNKRLGAHIQEHKLPLLQPHEHLRQWGMPRAHQQGRDACQQGFGAQEHQLSLP